MTIEEQVKETLESEDEVIHTIKYVKRYYLGEGDLIEDLKPVREDMEYYILTRMPEKFPGRTIEYLEQECDGSNEYNTFLNTGGEQYPICFSTQLREANTPPANVTDNDAVDVNYTFKVKLTW